MNTLPLFFNLNNKFVLIIGGGDIAYRKAILLTKSRAKLIVLAKNFNQALKEFLAANKHIVICQPYQKSVLAKLKTKYDFALLICATDDSALNRQVYNDCQSIGIYINVVDTPKLCDFIFPAIVDRDPITIGISSNGNSPVLARLIRAKIESALPSNIGDIAKKAGEFRNTVKLAFVNINQRRHFWEKIFQNVLNDKPIKDLADELTDFIKDNNSNIGIGEVYIVGAGAGNPDLLTFKALRLMQQADIVLYDALVSKEIVDLCRRDSDKVFVGKKRSNHYKTQNEINHLLVYYAKQGKRVLRLKGGDPFIFGRGGEEVLACRSACVPYQVVPGISAGLAAASGAGIALTHRNMATSVRFLTGCYQAGDMFDGLKSVYHQDETLVFYMGLHALDKVVDNLIASGLGDKTPIVIIANASLPNQQVLMGQLNNIVAKQRNAQLPAPAIIIVGRVVEMYQS